MIRINVADVRSFIVMTDNTLPPDDVFIANFLHNLKEYPDNEVHFYGRKYDNADIFDKAVRKTLMERKPDGKQQ